MSYAHSSRTMFLDVLDMLAHLVGKATAAGMADDVLVSKLADDMFPLELQFRIALNQVLLALDQVGGTAMPLEELPYASFAEVGERIAAVRSHLEHTDLSAWLDADAVVDLTLPNGARFRMTAREDIQDWIAPNLYFHATMAYALLRRAGLAIGKMDFLPHMRRHQQSAAQPR